MLGSEGWLMSHSMDAARISWLSMEISFCSLAQLPGINYQLSAVRVTGNCLCSLICM